MHNLWIECFKSNKGQIHEEKLVNFDSSDINGDDDDDGDILRFHFFGFHSWETENSSNWFKWMAILFLIHAWTY